MSKRAPQNLYKISPRVVGQFKIKTSGLTGSKEKLSGICLSEMQQVFLCFKTYSFNEEACSNEIGNFQKCYDTHASRYASKKANSEKSATAHINELLKKYPEKTKKDV